MNMQHIICACLLRELLFMNVCIEKKLLACSDLVLLNWNQRHSQLAWQETGSSPQQSV